MIDDINQITNTDDVILIIEADANFARVLLRIVNSNGYKGIIADNGKKGLLMALEHAPKGILLDLGLPDIDGKEVLEQLKFHLSTKNTPVHIVTGSNEDKDLLAMGARSFLQKPVTTEDVEGILRDIEYLNSKDIRKILVVEDYETNSDTIYELIENKGIETIKIGTGKEALAYLREHQVGCIVLDLDLPDISGFDGR